jgi:hypothetical protein
MTTPNTQPQPRTCGGCKWFIPKAGKLAGMGDCRAPAPMVMYGRWLPFAINDATRCPCWAAKEENYATKQ